MKGGSEKKKKQELPQLLKEKAPPQHPPLKLDAKRTYRQINQNQKDLNWQKNQANHGRIERKRQQQLRTYDEAIPNSSTTVFVLSIVLFFFFFFFIHHTRKEQKDLLPKISDAATSSYSIFDIL